MQAAMEELRPKLPEMGETCSGKIHTFAKFCPLYLPFYFFGWDWP